MEEAYAEVRGLSFEEIAEANLEAMLDWKLGPLFDPERSARMTEARNEPDRVPRRPN
jgi:hypothetical protein